MDPTRPETGAAANLPPQPVHGSSSSLRGKPTSKVSPAKSIRDCNGSGSDSVSGPGSGLHRAALLGAAAPRPALAIPDLDDIFDLLGPAVDDVGAAVASPGLGPLAAPPGAFSGAFSGGPFLRGGAYAGAGLPCDPLPAAAAAGACSGSSGGESAGESDSDGGRCGGGRGSGRGSGP